MSRHLRQSLRASRLRCPREPPSAALWNWSLVEVWKGGLDGLYGGGNLEGRRSGLCAVMWAILRCFITCRALPIVIFFGAVLGEGEKSCVTWMASSCFALAR